MNKTQKWINKNYFLFLFLIFLSGIALGILQGVLLGNLTAKVPLFYASILLIIEFAQPKEEEW